MLRKGLRIPYLILFLIILLVFILIIVFLSSSGDKAADYFPRAKMVKTFKGQLDNDGFTHIIDGVKDDKIQIKQSDANTNVAMVYDLSDDMVRLIYTSEEEEFKEDYISSLKENRNDIIIKSPLAVGTTWKDSIGGVYQIMEMDSIVKTPVGEFEAMVIGYINDDFKVREYYAKNIGLVKIVINNYLVSELVDIEIDN